MSARQRILLLVPSIRTGGMERLVSILTRGLDPERYAPEVVAVHRRDENPAIVEELLERAPITSLDKRSRFDVPRVVRRLQRILRQRRPAAAIGFMTYQNLLLIAAATLDGSRVPVVATEHVTPDALRATRGKRLQLGLAGRLYPRAAAVVPVSNGLRDALRDELGLRPRLLRTIYNPFDPNVDRLAAEDPPPEWFDRQQPVLVAVGRLTPQKAYPALVRALAMVRREVPARLLILGEGEERGAIEREAARLGLAESVDMPGYVPNPFPAMRRADAFVLASEWEAFPFVLVEATRVGAAIVATDVEFGPNEIIEDGRSGLLVPPGDEDALARAILSILVNRELASRLRAGAVERSALFTPERAMQQYDQLLQEVMAR
jgi:glycosyltransferase involved in cell wall biosynthesis